MGLSGCHIVGKPNELPLKRGSVDIYFDDYSTVNSCFTYNTFSTDLMQGC